MVTVVINTVFVFFQRFSRVIGSFGITSQPVAFLGLTDFSGDTDRSAADAVGALVKGSPLSSCQDLHLFVIRLFVLRSVQIQTQAAEAIGFGVISHCKLKMRGGIPTPFC